MKYYDESMEILPSLLNTINDPVANSESIRAGRLSDIAQQSRATNSEFQKKIAKTWENNDSKHPAIAQAQAFSQNSIAHLNQVEQFTQQIKENHAKLVEKTNQANIRKTLFTLFSALTVGAASLLLSPTLGPVLAILLFVGAAAAGGVAGNYTGDSLWMQPVRKELEIFKVAATNSVTQLYQTGKDIERSAIHEIGILNEKMQKLENTPPTKQFAKEIESEKSGLTTYRMSPAMLY